MKQIIISGASGDLGRRVTQLLLDDPRTRTLRLVTRTPDALRAQLADSHPSADVTVVHGDFEDPTSLDEAYRGGGTLLLISGLNIGRRVPEHQTAVAAAARAGVSHVVYTSVGGVQSGNPALSARDHQQSERDLIGSGLPHTILRNALYAEIVSNVLVAPGVQHGTIVQATGAGHLAPVAKDDVARSAAAVLVDPDRHAGAVYEITGPELLDFHDIARIASEVHGTPISYTSVTADERLAFFDSVGIPRTYDPGMKPSPDGHLWASDELVTAEEGIAQGYQALLSHHVEQITGRAPESLQTVMERVRSLRYDQITARVS